MLARHLWHRSITVERLLDAAYREKVALDNPGFCLICGDEAMECEPDARNYTCEACGAKQVFGAQEILLHLI